VDAFPVGHDMQMDVDLGGSSNGFRPDQGYKIGFGRNASGAQMNMMALFLMKYS
jgi:hypothetical protein